MASPVSLITPTERGVKKKKNRAAMAVRPGVAQARLSAVVHVLEHFSCARKKTEKSGVGAQTEEVAPGMVGQKNSLNTRVLLVVPY